MPPRSPQRPALVSSCLADRGRYGHLLARGTGCPIPREARKGLGPPALASYLSARSRRRFLVNGSAFSAKLRASTARCLKNSLSIDTPTQRCQHDTRCGSSSHTNRCRSPPTCMWFGPRPPVGLSRPHTALRLRALRMRFNQCGDLLDFHRCRRGFHPPQRLRGRDVTGRSTSRLYAPIDLSSFQHCPVRPRNRAKE